MTTHPDPAELVEALTSAGDRLMDAAYAVHMNLHNGNPVPDHERDELGAATHAWISTRQAQVDAARPAADRPEAKGVTVTITGPTDADAFSRGFAAGIARGYQEGRR